MIEPCVTRLREDSQAPESRPSSRHSSFRSVMGYRTHADLHYSSVMNNKPRGRESPHGSHHTAGAHGTSQSPPLKYDPRYGYPV